MSIEACLLEAVERGLIGEDVARHVQEEFSARVKQLLQTAKSETAAEAAARAQTEASLRAQAVEMRRRAALTKAKRLEINERLAEFVDTNGKANVMKAAEGLLSHYGYRGGSSVRGRQEAIIALAHGKLADMMFEHRRSLVLGKRLNTAGLPDLVRALKGEAVDNEQARAFAKAVGEVMEDLRQRFNAAGGAIGKLDGWGLPQTHDGLKIQKAGREAWKQMIAPLLDAEKMRDPLTGRALGQAGMSAALDHVYDTLVSQGWAHKVPDMVSHGKGALASQRQDARFLVFKDADSWMKYNEAYGRGDVLQGIFNHINAMAKDVAALEILGPNPDAMLEYLKNIVRHEYGKLLAGKESLAQKARFYKIWKGDAGTAAADHLESVWQLMRGQPQVASVISKTTGNAKNVMTAAMLGSTGVLSVATDPFIATANRRLAGLKVTQDMGRFLSMMKEQNRKDIIRSGVIWDEYMHLMRDEVRIVGMLSGSDWSKYLVDRSVMLSGVKPVTTGRKHVEARAWQAQIADEASKSFGQLDSRFRHTLEGFGVGEADWEVMRRAVDNAGFVTPMSIMEKTGRRNVAEKLAEVTSSWSERSVPSGTINSRAWVLGTAKGGTVLGEVASTATQFKSFGLSLTSLAIEAMAQIYTQGGRGLTGTLAAGRWLGTMALGMTIGAGLYMQIRSLSDGKDIEDMSKGDFWLRAMVQGGGFGLIGDFLASVENRHGQSLPESLLVGAAASFFGDVGDLGAAALGQAAGSNRNTARAAIKLMQRYTPVLSSHFATRGAYRHMILDQLQHMADPLAHKAFRTQMSQTRAATGQGYWWKPGEALPTRAPRF